MTTDHGKTVAAVLGLGLIACVLGMLIVFLPRPQQPRERADNQADANRQSGVLTTDSLPRQGAYANQIRPGQEQESKNHEPLFRVTSDNLPDWIMVLVTAVGLGATFYQIREAKKAVILTERADILVEKVGFTSPAPITRKSVMEFTLRNYGRTRANNVVVDIWQGMTESTKLEDAPSPIIVVGAGATVSPQFPPLSECLSDRGFDAVIAGKATFGYKGTVTYDDVFGVAHTLHTEGRYEPRTHSFRMIENTSD